MLRNDNFTIEKLIQYKDHPEFMENIVYNKNIKPDDIKRYDIPFRNVLLRNSGFKEKDVIPHLQSSLNYLYASKNPNMKNYIKNNFNIFWDYGYLSGQDRITLNMIEANPKEWDIANLLTNPIFSKQDKIRICQLV